MPAGPFQSSTTSEGGCPAGALPFVRGRRAPGMTGPDPVAQGEPNTPDRAVPGEGAAGLMGRGQESVVWPSPRCLRIDKGSPGCDQAQPTPPNNRKLQRGLQGFQARTV